MAKTKSRKPDGLGGVKLPEGFGDDAISRQLNANEERLKRYYTSTHCKGLLEGLAETFERRVGELQKWSRQWAEDPATIRAMELVYADIARALRAECEKSPNGEVRQAGPDVTK